MKKTILFTILFFLSFALLNCDKVSGQTINQISGRCQGTRNTSTVNVVNIGDIYYTPCAGRSSIFTGNVDFSGATIIGTGFITGSGTTNFVPRFTGTSSIGNTPLSWNNATYDFHNTLVNATFKMSLTPSAAGIGEFFVGDNLAYLQIVDSSDDIFISATLFENAVNAFRVTDTDYTSEFTLALTPSTTVGRFRVGDYTTTPTNYIDLNQATGTLNLSVVNSMNLTNDVATRFFTLDFTNDTIQSVMNDVSFFTPIFSFGDLSGGSGGNGTRFVLSDSAGTGTFTGNEFQISNSFAVASASDCAGQVTLDAAGIFDLKTTGCGFTITSSTVILVTGRNTTGVLTVAGSGFNLGKIISSTGAADSGASVNYWIIKRY